jgi:hypothetical protein
MIRRAAGDGSTDLEETYSKCSSPVFQLPHHYPREQSRLVLTMGELVSKAPRVSRIAVTLEKVVSIR